MTSPAKKTLLFVCTGNTCRSPMAERLAGSLCKDIPDWTFRSAGLFASPGTPPSEHAITALKEKNLSLQDHRATLLSPEHVREADLIVTMTRSHLDLLLQSFPEVKDKVHTLHSYSEDPPDPDVMDPFGGGLDTYRLVRDEIESALSDLILAELRPSHPSTS